MKRTYATGYFGAALLALMFGLGLHYTSAMADKLDAKLLEKRCAQMAQPKYVKGCPQFTGLPPKVEACQTDLECTLSAWELCLLGEEHWCETFDDWTADARDFEE